MNKQIFTAHLDIVEQVCKKNQGDKLNLFIILDQKVSEITES